ncbi:Uncharacterized protein Fot_43381 [Forsythia ovata]|uniref:Uncharacterized protein n=1 Tax=Forsythia ovata TaxID=205694 RepID=A0ABD1RSW2_9LAMI
MASLRESPIINSAFSIPALYENLNPGTNSKPTPSATSRSRFPSHGRAQDSPAKVARDSPELQSRAILLSYSRFPEPQSRVILSATSRARFSATVTASPPPPVAAVSHRLQPSLP